MHALCTSIVSTGWLTSCVRIRPRTVSDAQVEQVNRQDGGDDAVDATHWSTRSMAAEVGLMMVVALVKNVEAEWTRSPRTPSQNF